MNNKIINNLIKGILACVLSLHLSAGNCFAEVIRLKSGGVVKGVIKKVDDKKIHVSLYKNGKTKVIKKSYIKNIDGRPVDNYVFSKHKVNAKSQQRPATKKEPISVEPAVVKTVQAPPVSTVPVGSDPAEQEALETMHEDSIDEESVSIVTLHNGIIIRRKILKMDSKYIYFAADGKKKAGNVKRKLVKSIELTGGEDTGHVKTSKGSLNAIELINGDVIHRKVVRITDDYIYIEAQAGDGAWKKRIKKYFRTQK